MFDPLVREITSTPMARAPLDIRATAASPLIALRVCEMRRSITAATTTTGTATASGASPSALAAARAPKPTWLRPSPIIE